MLFKHLVIKTVHIVIMEIHNPFLYCIRICIMVCLGLQLFLVSPSKPPTMDYRTLYFCRIEMCFSDFYDNHHGMVEVVLHSAMLICIVLMSYCTDNVIACPIKSVIIEFKSQLSIVL